MAVFLSQKYTLLNNIPKYVILCIHITALGAQWALMIINSQVEFNMAYFAFLTPCERTCLIGGSTQLFCSVPYLQSPRWYSPDDSSKYITCDYYHKHI